MSDEEYTVARSFRQRCENSDSLFESHLNPSLYYNSIVECKLCRPYIYKYINMKAVTTVAQHFIWNITSQLIFCIKKYNHFFIRIIECKQVR